MKRTRRIIKNIFNVRRFIDTRIWQTISFTILKIGTYYKIFFFFVSNIQIYKYTIFFYLKVKKKQKSKIVPDNKIKTK